MEYQKKIEAIRSLTKELEQRVNTLADAFLQQLIENFVDRLEVQNGIVANTSANLALLSRIDALFTEFNAKVAAPAVSQTILGGFRQIHDFNVDYFSDLAESKAKYATTASQVEKMMLDRLGFGEKTKLKPGGFMDTMFKDPTIANEVKNFTRSEFVKNVGFKQLKEGLRRMIKTDQQSMGAFERYYRNYAYDIFVNIDREESLLTAKALDLKYFIYSGTLIDTSRDFCKKRAGKVFTSEETDVWVNDPWIQNALKKGYIASYDPIRDMGLWGCRHVPQFISREVAEKMRPELKPSNPANLPPAEETPNTFKPGKTIKESTERLDAYLAKSTGWPISVSRPARGMSLEEFNRRSETVSQLFSEYKLNPGMQNLAPVKIRFASQANYAGFVRTNTRVSPFGETIGKPEILEVNFGNRYARPEDRTFVASDLVQRAKSAVDPENLPLSTTVHEFAHVIAVERVATNKYSPDYYREFFSQLKEIRKQYGEELMALNLKGDKEGINKISLGMYALTNVDEFMAEAFAEYKLRKDPSKYAKQIGQLIDKYFKK